MPTQDLQTAAVGLQLRLRRWGTAAAKSRSACLSELRSEIARGRRLIMMKRKVNAAVEENLMESCLAQGC
jgi:hypothetical protein